MRKFGIPSDVDARTINALHTSAPAGVVGAGGDFSNTKKLENSMRNIGAKLEAAVQECAARTPLKENVLVDTGAAVTLFARRVKWVCGEQDVGVTSGHDRQVLNLGGVDRDAWSRWLGHRDGGSAER